MKEAGIEPLVTLHFYKMPLYLANHYDGRGQREVIDLFLRFCKVCFSEFGSSVKYWLTFNEIDSAFRHPWSTVGVCTDRYPSEKLEELL